MSVPTIFDADISRIFKEQVDAEVSKRIQEHIDKNNNGTSTPDGILHREQVNIVDHSKNKSTDTIEYYYSQKLTTMQAEIQSYKSEIANIKQNDVKLRQENSKYRQHISKLHSQLIDTKTNDIRQEEDSSPNIEQQEKVSNVLSPAVLESKILCQKLLNNIKLVVLEANVIQKDFNFLLRDVQQSRKRLRASEDSIYDLQETYKKQVNEAKEIVLKTMRSVGGANLKQATSEFHSYMQGKIDSLENNL